MEIILNRDRALKAVNVAKIFAETPSGLKILQHAFVSAGLGRVRLTTTDLALWCQVEMDAQTPEPGTAMVPVRTMGKVLKSLSQSRVSLHTDGDGVRFVAGSSEVRVMGIGPDDDTDEYPEINPPQDRLLAMPLNAALVDKVAYAVSKDETRYTLAGVYVEVSAGGLKLVATNGHRLARYKASLPPGSVLDVELSEPVTGIVPVRLLNEGVPPGFSARRLRDSGVVREGGRYPGQWLGHALGRSHRGRVPGLRQREGPPRGVLRVCDATQECLGRRRVAAAGLVERPQAGACLPES